MSLTLDQRFFIELMPNLDKLKRVNENIYQFRCPICLDSKKDKTKARGYIYHHSSEDFLRYKCHNCGSSLYFRTFLKMVNPTLYKKYIIESLKESGIYERDKKEEKLDINIFKSKRNIILSNSDNRFDGIVRLDKLDDDHQCMKYVVGRKIPQKMFPYLYFCDDFVGYVNSLIPNKIKSNVKESRLIIPYFDENGKFFAFQGRSLNPKSKLRYFTIKLNEELPKIYGLERLDKQKPIFCVEGPIDSMFLPNCIAVSGASYTDSFISKIKHNVTIVPDNERDNNEVCKSIEKAIDLGFKVCLWRKSLKFKDINEAVLSGISVDELVKIIREDTVSGFNGKIKFKLWKNWQI